MIPSENYINKKKIFIFDLDGVLIESKKNMKKSWSVVKKKFMLKKNFNDYEKFIGLKFLNILKKLKISKDLKKIEKEYKLQSIKNINLITLKPKVKFFLKHLRNKGKKIALLTSKDTTRTKIFIKKFNLKFDTIRTPVKNLPGKPNPFQINSIVKELKIKKENAVYIGDMKSDLYTAKNAKIDFIFVSTGFSKKMNCKYKIKNFSEIIY